MKRFIFETFNQRRAARGADAARVLVIDENGDEWSLWMSKADIRGNVQEFGPHYGLLVAARRYHMDLDALVAVHKSRGKNEGFLLPIEPARDSDGLWTHPDYPAAEEGQLTEADFSQWLNQLGLESHVEVPPYCANCESDAADWEPAAPEGDGWFVGSIHESEDGPVCVWLRKLEVA